ncbi:TPA: hypothetical protein ACKUKM_001995 [Neisseria gonorrhoeae]
MTNFEIAVLSGMTGFEIAVLSGMTGFEIAVLSGMTGFEIVVLSDGFRDYGVVGTQPNRHSHGSGNLGRGVWATVLSDKFPCGQI